MPISSFYGFFLSFCTFKQTEVSHRRKKRRDRNLSAPSSSLAYGSRSHSGPEPRTQNRGVPEAPPYPDYVEAGNSPPSYQEVMNGNYPAIHSQNSGI